jgi:hypothetical protein
MFSATYKPSKSGLRSKTFQFTHGGSLSQEVFSRHSVLVRARATEFSGAIKRNEENTMSNFVPKGGRSDPRVAKFVAGGGELLLEKTTDAGERENRHVRPRSARQRRRNRSGKRSRRDSRPKPTAPTSAAMRHGSRKRQDAFRPGSRRLEARLFKTSPDCELSGVCRRNT